MTVPQAGLSQLVSTRSAEVVSAQDPDLGEPDPPGVREQKVFPNALRVSGLKHICDNLLGSTLHSLPQCFSSSLKLFCFQ